MRRISAIVTSRPPSTSVAQSSSRQFRRFAGGRDQYHRIGPCGRGNHADRIVR